MTGTMQIVEDKRHKFSYIELWHLVIKHHHYIKVPQLHPANINKIKLETNVDSLLRL